ncbi:MAG: bifunctional diaminohydroxyphosphoribosylaminopyrimidine deaminase/5-amino-6-(5-phosphoribosylamino)uracil reductase RibD, partial [Candidatus Binataceae bacterium]
HQGETSACARVLIKAGVRRVVVGCVDPYPPVHGRGVRILREGGILVSVGMMETECRRLNEGFITRVTRGRPFVILKLAASLDGRIAASGGDSKWVSSPESRALVHRWRRECDAVLTGAGTIIADDPRLTCRIPGGRDPLRIIVDSRLRSPADARVFRQRSPALTLLVTSRANLERARRRYASPRVEAMAVSGRGDELALDELMYEMGKRKLNRVLIEGGAHTAGSALRYGIVDRIAMFIAPRIVGAGLPAIEGLATGRMRDALALDGLETSQVGEDLLVQAIVRRTTRARRGGPNRAAPVKKAGLEKQPAR